MDYRQAILQRLAQAQGSGGPLPVAAPQVQQEETPNPMDPRGMLGTLLRGPNIYNAGSLAAQNGGPNIGRPQGSGGMQQAAARRLGV